MAIDYDFDYNRSQVAATGTEYEIKSQQQQQQETGGLSGIIGFRIARLLGNFVESQRYFQPHPGRSG